MKYGIRFDGENSAGIRLYDAEGLTWERSSNESAGQDDFANIAPFNIKECITQYNEETKEREILAYKGDSNWDSLVADKIGDRMIEIPCFWYQRPLKYEFIVSDIEEEGFKSSPMHYRNGVLYKTVRISKYALNSDYISQTGEIPRVSTNMNTFRTNLKAKGQYVMDYPTWCSLVMLMLVKYGNMDVQSTVGAGRNSGKAVIASGNTDSVLGADGSATDVGTNESVLTLGIENFYSNVFKFIDGLYSYNASLYIKDIEEIESDPISAEELQNTYNMVTEKIPESGVNANIGDIAYDEDYDWMLFPTANGTPNPSGDRYITNKSFNSVVTGGSAWLGASDGLFFFMVLAVGSTGTGGGAMAIEFGEPTGGDIVKETDISFSNLSEYDGLLRNDINILRRNIAYTQNQIVNKGKVFLKCTVAGTTDTETLSLTNVEVDDILIDGTVTWKVLSVTGVPEGSGEIPIANESIVGGVKSTTVGGGIKVNPDGTMEYNVPESSVDPVVSTAWQPDTEYKVNNVVGNDGMAYICLQNHTSSNDFDMDYLQGYWNKVDMPKVGASGYVQVLAMGVRDASSSNPHIKSLAINPTNSFILPPIEVLEEAAAESAIINDLHFDNADATDFNYDSDFVKFDGTMHLKTEYDINMSTPTIITDGTNTGYMSESDDIDFSDYDNVEGVNVE